MAGAADFSTAQAVAQIFFLNFSILFARAAQGQQRE
jgi:hypothetical protein